MGETPSVEPAPPLPVEPAPPLPNRQNTNFVMPPTPPVETPAPSPDEPPDSPSANNDVPPKPPGPPSPPSPVKPKPPKPKPSKEDDASNKPPPPVVLPEHVVDQVKEEADSLVETGASYRRGRPVKDSIVRDHQQRHSAERQGASELVEPRSSSPHSA